MLPGAGVAGGKSSRSASLSVRSSGLSAPIDASSAVGPPAMARRAAASTPRVDFAGLEPDLPVVAALVEERGAVARASADAAGKGGGEEA